MRYKVLPLFIVIGVIVWLPIAFMFQPSALLVFQDEVLISTARFTLLLGLCVSMTATIIGAGLGLLLFLWINPGTGLARVFRLLLQLPLIVPSLFYAICYVSLLANVSNNSSFLIGIIFSPVSVWWVLVAIHSLWIGLQFWQSLLRFDLRAWDAAASLGATIFQRLRLLMMRRFLKVAIIQSLQTFVWSISSFAVVTLVGGGPRSQTLEVLIYRHARLGDWNVDQAQAAAITLALLCLVPWLLMQKLSQKWNDGFFTSLPIHDKLQFCPLLNETNAQRFVYIFSGALGSIVLGVILLPVFWSGFTSILDFLTPHTQIQTSNFIGSEFWVSFGISILLGLIANFFALGVSSYAAWARGGNWTKVLMQSPGALSGFTLGLAWLVLLGPKFSELPVWFFSWLLLPVLLGVQILPFYDRQLGLVFDDQAYGEFEVASTLGASGFQKLKWIVIQRAWPAFRQVFVVGMAFCSAEIALVSLFFLDLEGGIPFSMYLSRLYGQYRFNEVTHANFLGVLLFAGLALLFEIIYPGLQRSSYRVGT